DFTGLKMRVIPSQLLSAQYEAWGASPTPVDFKELYTALEQGLVDGQENPAGTILDLRLYEVQKYLTESRHGFLHYLIIVHQPWFDAQTPAHQAILVQAMREAGQWQRQGTGEGGGGRNGRAQGCGRRRPARRRGTRRVGGQPRRAPGVRHGEGHRPHHGGRGGECRRWGLLPLRPKPAPRWRGRDRDPRAGVADLSGGRRRTAAARASADKPRPCLPPRRGRGLGGRLHPAGRDRLLRGRLLAESGPVPAAPG